MLTVHVELGHILIHTFLNEIHLKDQNDSQFLLTGENQGQNDAQSQLTTTKIIHIFPI